MEKHVDPSASNIHRGDHRPEPVTALQLQATCPRAEVIEILAGAVFSLIAEGRVSSSHMAAQRAEMIP
jgi:hypothetical protein